ncbi:MAG: hypothetical protein JXA14_26150 [Anaerolineae bacterium]|nr:hypothetical protein [Anaerolineae bacterium]
MRLHQTVALILLLLAVFSNRVIGDERPWWEGTSCNLPRPFCPDAGCETVPIAPPGSKLPPPCVRFAHTETRPSDDNPGIDGLYLVVVLDHPEDPYYTYPDPFATERVVVWREEGGDWQTDRYGWYYDGGRNSAPLAWALRESLNTGSADPLFQTYTVLPPLPLLELIESLGISNPFPHQVFLPLVQEGESP